jgi:hypothetical protein
MKRLGYLSVLDAIRLLQAGLPIYVVSAPVDTNALPLEGGWKDEEGRIHYDLSCICLNIEKAYEIGRLFNQECILSLYPSSTPNGEVYLLKDTPFARQVALEYAGGYTGDGEWLFTAITGDTSIFEEAYEDFVPVEIDFLPVK